jgi:hypothetical protein
MVKNFSRWLVRLVMVSFVFMVPAVEQLHADIACCASLKQVTMNCSSPTCSGSVTFNVCMGGQYGGWFTELSWTCCSSSGNSWGCPCLGPCYGGSSPSDGASQASATWDAGIKPIFLRTCSGRYVLVRLGTAT